MLVDGQVDAEGQLDELLETCEEMRRLWCGDLGDAEIASNGSDTGVLLTNSAVLPTMSSTCGEARPVR